MWTGSDVLRTAALVFAMYIAARVLWTASAVIFVAFLGVLVGLALTSGVDALQRRGLPRGFGAVLIVLVGLSLVTAFLTWMAPTLAAEGRELRQRLPEAVDRVEGWLESQQGGVVGAMLGIRDTAAVSADTGSATRQPADRVTPPEAVADSIAVRESLRERFMMQIQGAARLLFPFLSSTLAVVAGLLFVLVLAVYVSVDPETYRQGIMHLAPHRHRERLGEMLSAVAATLRRWMLAQFAAMVVVGITTTVVLYLLDVKAAMALGIVAGLLEFVPTFGPIIAAVPAIAMGFLDSPEKALWVTLAYVGIQQAESQLLTPLLMRGAIALPPAVTLTSQALMAVLFGFLGLMVAVPLTAAVIVVVKLLYVEAVVGDEVEVLGRDNAPDESPSSAATSGS